MPLATYSGGALLASPSYRHSHPQAVPVLQATPLKRLIRSARNALRNRLSPSALDQIEAFVQKVLHAQDHRHVRELELPDALRSDNDPQRETRRLVVRWLQAAVQQVLTRNPDASVERNLVALRWATGPAVHDLLLDSPCCGEALEPHSPALYACRACRQPVSAHPPYAS